MANKYDQMGFVTLDEIQNVFTVKLDELEQKVFPTCPSTERRADQAYIMTALDGIRQELMKRSRVNLQHYMEHNPQVKAADREKREETTAAKNKASYDDRMRLGRANYNRAYGGGS